MSHSAELDPSLGLTLSAADLLVPLFINAAGGDHGLARKMAISGIDAYHPQSRADHINSARTISFSLAALALLGQAASPDMSMAEKMRAFGRANALNRSADQSERTMMRRRDHLRSSSADESLDEIPGPLEEADMQAAIDEAVADYVTACAQAKSTARATASPLEPVAVAAAYEPATVGLAPPPRPATSSTPTQSGSLIKPGSSIKQSLLATSAMPSAFAAAVIHATAMSNGLCETPTAPISQLMPAAAD